MLKKLRTEAESYDFVRRAALWLVLGAVIGGGYYRSFLENCPGGGRGELVIYVLTNHHFILMFMAVLVLAFTSAKAGEARRYPLLLRYRTRGEALAARVGARAVFAAFMVLTQVLILGVAGRGLPARGNVYPQAGSVGYTIVCQCLNIMCYLVFLLFLREIFQNLFRNTALEILFTLAISFVTRAAVLRYNTPLVLISPWGNIAYMLAYNLPDFHSVNELNILVEIERVGYRFFWQYWLIMLVVAIVPALWLERNRDYVFEQHRRSG